MKSALFSRAMFGASTLLARAGRRALPAPPASRLSTDLSGPLAAILNPVAASRWTMPTLGNITPQYIEMVLRAALAGDHGRQAELFELMEDTWPRLGHCALQIKRAVANLVPTFTAYRDEDEEPSENAVRRMKVCSAAWRSLAPDPAADENDENGTVLDLLDGWLKSCVVLEMDWHQVSAPRLGQFLAPRCTRWVHPNCYAWSMSGRLGLRLTAARDASGKPRERGHTYTSAVGSTGLAPLAGELTEFPADKFLIGVNKFKSGSVLGAALLRPLAFWWCAANFSADWLLNLAQLFGIPFRVAYYNPDASPETIGRINAMLQNMGSAPWGSFPVGTQIDFKESNSRAAYSPQADMLERADKACSLLVLGQTLTGDTGGGGRGGGSLALGRVHEEVKQEVVSAAARYVAAVIEKQFCAAVLRLNFGDTSEPPRFALESQAEEDLAQKAGIIQTLAAAGAGGVIGLDWLGKTFGIPKPSPGEETLASAKHNQSGDAEGDGGDDWGDAWDLGPEEEEGEENAKKDESSAELQSSDATGHPFRGNQHTGGIPDGGDQSSQDLKKKAKPRPELRETRVPVNPALASHLGIDPNHVFADYGHLAKKHPEYFQDSHEAKAYVEWVLARPTHVFNGNHPDHKMVVRRDGDNKAVALDIAKKGGKFRVRSAHTLSEAQFYKQAKATGPGATLGISRVDSLFGKTPSRSLGGPHGTPPVVIQKLLQDKTAVKSAADASVIVADLTQILAIEGDAEFSAALKACAKKLTHEQN